MPQKAKKQREPWVKCPWLIDYYFPSNGSRYTALRTMYEEKPPRKQETTST
jgi:hypothetical protein